MFITFTIAIQPLPIIITTTTITIINYICCRLSKHSRTPYSKQKQQWHFSFQDFYSSYKFFLQAIHTIYNYFLFSLLFLLTHSLLTTFLYILCIFFFSFFLILFIQRQFNSTKVLLSFCIQSRSGSYSLIYRNSTSPLEQALAQLLSCFL